MEAVKLTLYNYDITGNWPKVLHRSMILKCCVIRLGLSTFMRIALGKCYAVYRHACILNCAYGVFQVSMGT